MKKHTLGILLLAAACTAAPPDPYGPLPTPGQVRWQRMEMNMFCHFGPNTFSGAEWGSGAEPEDLFAPSSLDCRQWARTAAAAGFKGIIVTAKHHDGFCLWPNPESSHTVARSGAPDVLRELSAACREYGLGFGVYISPWDRNDPAYGSPEYNLKYARTLRSVLDGSYGPVFELWFDGACGEGPGGRRQEYDWPLFRSTVRSLQSGTIMFSDTGPGARWVGNEDGVAPPDEKYVQNGLFLPYECDCRLRPYNWFFSERDAHTLRPLDNLTALYDLSVGRGGNLLINIGPDRRGLLPEADAARFAEFGAWLAWRFQSPHPATVTREENGVSLSTGSAVYPHTLVLCEALAEGQQIEGFKVFYDCGAPVLLCEGAAVGHKRILSLPPVLLDGSRRLKIEITAPRGAACLKSVSIY